MPRRRRAVATTRAIVRTRTVAPRVAIVRVPGAGMTRRGRAGALVRRGATAAGRAIRDEKHTLTALLAAGTLGFMKKSGVSLPKVPQLGTAGTYGVAAWIGAKMTKNQTLAHVATGLLSISAFQLASGETLTGVEDDGDEW